MKTLVELLKNVKVTDTKGDINIPISSIVLNSKEATDSSLFVAINGHIVDGHQYIDEAIKNGATAVVYQDNIPEFEKGIAYLKVEDTHMAVGVIASNFYDNPSEKLRLVGVTGTNGKTTITTLLYKMFIKLGYKVGLIGTVANMINERPYKTDKTTPDAITLNKLLNDMVSEGCGYCFMEVSSHAIAEGRVSGISFTGGVFSNLTLDHLDYHKTFENYKDAKKKFFDQLPVYAFAVSNNDDEVGKYMVKDTKAHKYFYSLSTDSDFTGYIETKLIGEFNAYNILAIYSTAMVLGQEEEKVRGIIKELEPVQGRFQYVKSDTGVTGIVDYAHTPDALENVLKTIRDMRDKSGNGKIISIFGCGGDRDKSKRPIMAKIGYEMSDIVILTSDNPRTENPEDIINDMKKGIPQALISVGAEKVAVMPDRRLAIKKACELANKGDYILVAGKGHENYQEVNGIKNHFDDIEELSKYLK